MNKKIALLVLLFAVTAMVCRSDDDAAEKEASWTDWAKDKISGAFNSEQVKSTSPDAADTTNEAASGTGEYMSEKALEEEDAAADAAKELSNKPHD